MMRLCCPAIVRGVCLLAKSAELCCPLCTIDASVLDSRRDAARNASVWWTCSFGLGQSLVWKTLVMPHQVWMLLHLSVVLLYEDGLLPVYAQERTGNTI